MWVRDLANIQKIKRGFLNPRKASRYFLPRPFLKQNGPILINEENEKKLEKNLVWIFGMHRSGTTWLGKQLLSYHTHFWNEPGIGRFLGTTIDSGPKIRRIEMGQRRKSFFFQYDFKDTWLLYLKKLILARIYAEFQDTSKKIIVQEPNGSMGSDILSESLPQSKIIIVQRDPRDIIDSMVDGMKEGGWRSNWLGYSLTSENRLSFIEDQANKIVNTWEILWKTYKNHSKNLLYLVKYEDLRKNTLQELEKLYRFIEIDIDKKILEKIYEKTRFENLRGSLKGSGKSRRSATPGKWKENLSNEDKNVIEKILIETLKKLGYE